MTKKLEAWEYCAECGQVTKGEPCTRCDEICEHCKYKRRAHITVEGKEFCPTTVFANSGEWEQ